MSNLKMKKMEYVKVTSKCFNYEVEVEKNYYEKNFWMLRDYIYSCFQENEEFHGPFKIKNAVDIDPEEFLDALTRQIEEIAYFKFGVEFMKHLKQSSEEAR